MCIVGNFDDSKNFILRNYRRYVFLLKFQIKFTINITHIHDEWIQLKMLVVIRSVLVCRG